jgi:adenylate cyclase
MGTEPRQDEYPKRMARLAAATRRFDANPALVEAARTARAAVLPGDARYGDELSTAEQRPSQVLARRLADVGAREPRASRELGLGILQMWQAFSESVGRGAGTEQLAVMFTDVVGFSSWALEAGDELALELLREVAAAVEPAVLAHGGRIVKRLGDGHMAVFLHAGSAVDAAFEAQRTLAAVSVGGHTPQLRVGVHVGRPRRLGSDYLGVDVNVAARLMQAARPDTVLVSGPALAQLDTTALEVKPLRRFRAKGAPRDLGVSAVTPRSATEDPARGRA